MKEDMEEKELTYEELLHYYHSTVGLWVIDRNPQEVHFDWICKNAFQLGMDKILSNTEKIGKNLKPFDLQAAKSGKPVCTRDGRKARIVCFDAKGIQPIVVLVTCGNEEKAIKYSISGRFRFDGIPDEADLMMLPEKKEGWVNLYRDEESKRVYSGEFIFSEREKAEKHYECNDTKVATVPINWEE